MGGIIYHDVFSSQHTLTEIWQAKQGEIQFITIVSTVIFSFLLVLVGYFMSVMNDNMNDNKTLLTINKGLNEKMITIMEVNSKRQDELMTKLNENTESDLKTMRQVVNLEKIVVDHEGRIKRLERS